MKRYTLTIETENGSPPIFRPYCVESDHLKRMILDQRDGSVRDSDTWRDLGRWTWAVEDIQPEEGKT